MTLQHMAVFSHATGVANGIVMSQLAHHFTKNGSSYVVVEQIAMILCKNVPLDKGY